MILPSNTHTSEHTRIHALGHTRLGVFSLMADFANLLAYCVVFFFDFSNIEAHGVSGKASNLVGVPFALGIAIYCYEGAGMVLALEASMYVIVSTT